MSGTAPRRQLVELAADLQIDLLRDGSEQHPSVVLLPSSLRDSLDCDAVAHHLAEAGWQVLRPQPRGMARSRGPMAGLSLSVLAADVVQLLTALRIERAVLAGHAFGHFVARVAAMEHPARVRGVALLAAAARLFPPGLTDALDIAANAGLPTADRLQALQRAFFAPGNDPTPWLDGWYPQWRTAYRAAGASPPKDRWWPTSPVPLLDLQAEADPWRPPLTRDELREALGASVTIDTIAHASHALLPEQPAAVAAAIDRWARRLA